MAKKTKLSPTSGRTILYSETHRVPILWWILSIFVAALLGWQAQMHRNAWLGVAVFLLTLAAAFWSLWTMSRNSIRVTEDESREKWLETGPAQLPARVIDRTLVIPSSAKQNALGRQLDPAAYVVNRTWVPSMAMVVLNDPQDPTPYWLVSAQNPERLLKTLGIKMY